MRAPNLFSDDIDFPVLRSLSPQARRVGGTIFFVAAASWLLMRIPAVRSFVSGIRTNAGNLIGRGDLKDVADQARDVINDTTSAYH